MGRADARVIARRKLSYGEHIILDRKWGDVVERLKRQAIQSEAKRTTFEDLFDVLVELKKYQSAAVAEHTAVVDMLSEQIRTDFETQPITSVVLITHPIAGGSVYSQEPGVRREIVLDPDAVQLHDIAEVVLIKAGVEVGRRSVDEVRQLIDDFLPFPPAQGHGRMHCPPNLSI